MIDPVNSYKNAKFTVLVVYNEPASGKIWSSVLQQIDLHVHMANITEDIIGTWREVLPDMVIFEDFNTKIEELSICHELRKLTPIPILLLTSKDDEKLLLDAYQSGFDECIVQPLHPLLFLAKIRAWMRYSHFIPSALVEDVNIQDYLLEIQRRSLTTPEGIHHQLTYLETDFMYILMKNTGKPVDPDILVDSIWGKYGGGDKIMLKNLVYRLRHKIESNSDSPSFLLTDGRLGYTFSPQ